MRAGIQHFLRGIGWRASAVAVMWMMAAAGAAGAADQPGISKEEAERDLAALRERMESINERLRADRDDRGELERRMEELDQEISRLAAGIRRTDARRAEARREIENLSQRMGGLQAKMEAHRERVAELAYSMYVMGRPSRLKLFLNQRDPTVVNRMLGYHEYIVAARARTIERINGWAAELAELSAEQEARRQELEELAAAYRSQQEALQARREERGSALAALNQRIAASESELARLKENETRLQGVIQEIDEYLSSQRSHGISEGAFRAMKGKLRLPVSAPVSARFGDTRGTGVKWDGLMLRPPGGADVEAIFEGRVVFADWLRGFGLLLIIDHGDGFMSLYSHNDVLLKGVGDWVDTREVIAAVGNSGGLDRPGLYFEIRNNGEPQDPLSWCRKG